LIKRFTLKTAPNTSQYQGVIERLSGEQVMPSADRTFIVTIFTISYHMLGIKTVYILTLMMKTIPYPRDQDPTSVKTQTTAFAVGTYFVT